MSKIHIQFTLFSAFYSPLIAVMSGGFLDDEGLEYEWSVAEPGTTAIDAVVAGKADLCQTALSQSFTVLGRGEVPRVMHFAQINEMDGFFVTAREPDPDFRWTKLEGSDVVLFGGGQPLAMFQYACHKAGIDFSRINALTPGGAAAMDAAFRAGEGAYVQQQGPFPQQLEADGVGHIVAQSGPMIGPNGFSSLAATPEWLASDTARAFTRAYTRTRAYMNETPAAEIAAAQQSYFPRIDADVLTRCIATYQALGCWTPHLEITRPAYEVTLDVFAHFGTLKQRYAWEQVCCAPPAV